MRGKRESLNRVRANRAQPVARDVPVQVIGAIHRHRQHRFFQRGDHQRARAVRARGHKHIRPVRQRDAFRRRKRLVPVDRRLLPVHAERRHRAHHTACRGQRPVPHHARQLIARITRERLDQGRVRPHRKIVRGVVTVTQLLVQTRW